MFERLTSHSWRVVTLAEREARRLGHHFIGTEHLLLGILGEGSSVAYQALAAQAVDLNGARTYIQKTIGRGSGTEDPIPFTLRSERVFELSSRQATALGQQEIGPEHLLSALLRVRDGVATEVLASLDVVFESLRRSLGGLMGVDLPTNMPQTGPWWPFSCCHPDEDLMIFKADEFQAVRCWSCDALVATLPKEAG